MAEEEPLLPDAPPPAPPPAERWRDGAAFWLLGLCNNLPYVVMLSAARDLLQPPTARPGQPPGSNGSAFDCNPQSTGAVLLADILPTLLIKLAAPFVIHLLPYNSRVVAAALCAWGSFGLVAAAAGSALSLGGVVLASAASGLGEVTFLGLASQYPRYFFLLGPPPCPTALPHGGGLTAGERWQVAKAALPQAAPLAVVYFAEYFINQGLLELLYFPDAALTHNEQYRWYQLIYQGGVFLARSSVRCLRCRRVGLLALLQVLNAALLLAAVPGRFLPGFGAACALVLGEGLVGGGAYGSGFSNVAEQAAPWGRALAVAVAALGDTVGVALAGGAAVGIHRLFCGA
ncbi:battenin isoform X9 [Larus michahellis]|uniref:battenin isoform X9 n=1 Tax=Larus michahellis TaxID=119627 RepID=UPI003D9B2FCB